MTVWDADGTGRIHFDAAELHADTLGTIVENRSIVRALFTELADSNVTVMDGVRVQGWSAGAGIQLDDGRTLSAKLVVGADGAQSRLRQWSGLATREWDYDQQAIVCTVRTRQPHQYTAWQRFSPTGAAGVFAVVDGVWRRALLLYRLVTGYGGSPPPDGVGDRAIPVGAGAGD